MFDLEELVGEEWTKEELEVLGCEPKNTFIRGWNKNKTLDLVCKKIRALLDLEDFLHPKEILIVLRDEGEKEPFVERLGGFLEDGGALNDIEFRFFGEFINTFAPRKQGKAGEKRLIRQISLKREWKVIFMIDPEVGNEVFLIKLLQKLFPEEGAKLFFWEYENFINPHFILNGFPDSELINLLEIGGGKRTTPKPKRDRPAAPKKNEKKEKENQLSRRKKKFQKIIAEIRKEQFSGKSFLDFRIMIAPGEDPQILEETFREIFRNEFETFRAWIEINRLNGERKAQDDKLYNLVHRWKIYGRENYLAIKSGRKIYRNNFMEMFEDLGFKRVMFNHQPQRWGILKEVVEDLTLNQPNMGKIMYQRFSRFCEIVERDIFVEDPSAVNPVLSPNPPGVTKKIIFLEPKTRTDKNSSFKYKSIIDSIEKLQNYGIGYPDFQITVSPLEDAETKGEIMEKIFLNEMSIFIVWLEINALNCLRKPIPREFLRRVKRWNFYNRRNMERIINGQLTYGDNFKNLFIDLGIKDYLLKKYPQKWKILKVILKNLSLSREITEIRREMRNGILGFSKHLNPSIFNVVCGTAKPQCVQLTGGKSRGYLDPKMAEYPWEDDDSGEPTVGYSDVIEERMDEIVEKIGKAQSYGASFSDFQIVINGDLDKKIIDKYFSKIFLNEFGIFMDWLKIIECRNGKRNIPGDLAERVKKWPKQSWSRMGGILEVEGRVNIRDPLKFFERMKIKDYLMEYNPDLMAIFYILLSLDTAPKDGNAEKLTKYLVSAIRDESKKIVNRLFIKSNDHMDPPRLNYSYRRRGIEYISNWGKNNKKITLGLLRGESKPIQRTKYRGRRGVENSIEPFNPLVAFIIVTVLVTLVILIVILTTTKRW